MSKRKVSRSHSVVTSRSYPVNYTDTKTHWGNSQNDVGPEGVNVADAIQSSRERVIIKDSSNVQVTTVDTKAAVALQAAIEVAIGVVINIAVLGNAGGANQEAEKVLTDLLQKSKIKQLTRQHTLVENSKDVTISTVDTEVAANIQVLIQVLVAVAVNLGILGNAGA